MPDIIEHIIGGIADGVVGIGFIVFFGIVLEFVHFL